MKCLKCGHSFNGEKWDNICPKCSTYNRDDSYADFMRQDSESMPTFHRPTWQPPSFQREDGDDYQSERETEVRRMPRNEREQRQKPEKSKVKAIIIGVIIAMNVIPAILSVLANLIFQFL